MVYILFLYSSSVFFLAAPVIAVIILNVFFLCHVIKILNSKLETESSQLGSSVPITVRSTKAVMVLIPIFGLQFLLLPIRPSKGNNQTWKSVNSTSLVKDPPWSTSIRSSPPSQPPPRASQSLSFCASLTAKFRTRKADSSDKLQQSRHLLWFLPIISNVSRKTCQPPAGQADIPGPEGESEFEDTGHGDTKIISASNITIYF